MMEIEKLVLNQGWAEYRTVRNHGTRTYSGKAGMAHGDKQTPSLITVVMKELVFVRSTHDGRTWITVDGG